MTAAAAAAAAKARPSHVFSVSASLRLFLCLSHFLLSTHPAGVGRGLRHIGGEECLELALEPAIEPIKARRATRYQHVVVQCGAAAQITLRHHIRDVVMQPEDPTHPPRLVMPHRESENLNSLGLQAWTLVVKPIHEHFSDTTK